MAAPLSIAATASLVGGLDLSDEIGDLLGLSAAPFGKLSDFIGDDGKAFAVRSCTSGFDGSVQRQEVGLFGNVVNGLGHGTDLLTDPRLDLTSLVGGTASDAVDDLTELGHGDGCLLSRPTGLLSPAGHVLDSRGHLLDG